MKIKAYIILVFLTLFCLPMTAQTFYEVVSKKLDILGQPDADAKVLGQKKEHDLVEVYSIVNGWAIIKYETGTGFVDQYCIKSVDEESGSQSSSILDGRNEETFLNEGNRAGYGNQSGNRNFSTWSGATIYSKSMVNGEGALFYKGLYYVVLSKEDYTVAVVKPKGVKYKESSYVIPSNISIAYENFTVTEIAPGAFANNSNLVEVILPESLISINSNSFANCRRLSHIKFPPNLKYVGEMAFCGDDIADIILPNSIEELAKQAFYSCKSPKNVYKHLKMGKLYLPNTIKKIGKDAFRGDFSHTTEFDIQNLPDWISPIVAKEIGLYEESFINYIRQKEK